jgi:hypothetical protein
LRAGLSEAERNNVQIRYDGGGITLFPDFQRAWEEFISNNEAWKISWTARNSKRIRITKKEPRLFQFSYVEDIMDDILETPRI